MLAKRQGARFGDVKALFAQRASLAIAAVVLMLLGLAIGFALAVEYVSRPDRFPVRTVRFEGEFDRVDEARLMKTVVDHVRGNFFLLDLDAVRARVQNLPWVRQASVRREWPLAIFVRFEEQRLVARWGDDLWLNAFSELVDLGGEAGPEGLPLLHGPKGTQSQVFENYQSMNQIVSRVGLDISRLELSPRRTWRVDLSNEIPLVLGRDQPETKLLRFIDVYGTTLANRADQIKQVDLRYTNGFSVEWARLYSRANARNEG